ncbi:hypothetical protein SynA15127_00849 [Synechococcus sp. A15-127]|nr:hypothetical protein SynA15127_00849 [Synechococcus sp. A15-127]
MTKEMFPPSRKDRILDAHPWMSAEQCHALLAHNYQRFTDVYRFSDTDGLMDNFTDIMCNSDEDTVKNKLSVALEFCVISNTH